MSLAAALCLAAAPVPERILVVMPDGSVVGYVPERPATQPTTKPATQPGSVASPVPSPLYSVAPGQSWAAAVRAAKPGDTVTLAPGVYTDALTDADLRLDRVTIEGNGAVIRVAEGSALVLYRPNGVTIRGLKFEAAKPTASGVRIFGGNGVTIDGCSVTGFTFGATIEPSAKNRSADITVVRSTISGNWNPNGDSSGLYAQGVDRITIEATAFDGNGWKEGVSRGSIRNHNAYLAGDCTAVVVRASSFSRASSHGLQARAGGLIENNVFTDNPIHLSFGLVNGGGPITPGGVTGSVKGNRFVGTRPLAGQPRGWAIEIGNVRDVDIDGNTFDGSHTFDPKKEIVAAIKTDVCRLSPSHPQAKDVVKIGRLRIDGNAGRWPGGLLRQGAKADALTVREGAWK